jgi:ribosome small subunit-dependent GTPase A
MARWQDDHAVFDRPRKRTRPRTKDRPDYSDAPEALVASIDRGRYRCLLDDHTAVTATKARVLGRKGVIVGDRVKLDGDVSGTDGTLARIVEVAERRTWLRRSADDADTFERPIVANADQLMIVTALADPEPRMGMIDRILVAAYDAHVSPILCLTKADLASPEDLRDAYAPLDIPIVVTRPGCDLSPVRKLLEHHTTVLIGHSGVGKSTLVNELVPGTGRTTGAVSDVTGKGRHTSTSAAAIALPGDGWIIDTPGVRSFGISHVRTEAFVGAFPDLEELVANCPRGCRHDSSAPECALDEAVRTGSLGAERLLSFRRMERAFA